MIILPIDVSTAFAPVGSLEELSDQSGDAVYDAGTLHGVRSRTDKKEIPSKYIAIENAHVIVTDHEIFYLTSAWKYVPDVYPKAWPYARYLVGDQNGVSLAIESYPEHKLAGTFFVPFNVSGNWFHKLFDNYARMYYFTDFLRERAVRIAIPFWGSPMGEEPGSDRAAVHAAFFQGQSAVRMEKGIYQIERVLAPPLGNVADYIFAKPARFVSDRLREKFVGKSFTHRNRIFVSRADNPVRNVVNEAELTDALRRLGFMILCPGDYSFRTQLELFASSEIIVGVHGQGLTPIICANGCRAVFEIEAAGWRFTSYRSIAEIMGISYRKLPSELLENRNPDRFDWLARINVAECVAMIEAAL